MPSMSAAYILALSACAIGNLFFFAIPNVKYCRRIVPVIIIFDI